MRKTQRTGWLLGAVAAGLVADGLFRGSRARRLASLPPAGPAERVGGFRLISAADVEVSADHLSAATAYATANELDVLDLIPAGLDTARTLELLLLADPRSFRRNRMAMGVSGGHAVLVSEAVFHRAEVTKSTGLSADELDELAIKLKRYATVSSDLVVVPGLRPVAATVADRRAFLRRRTLQYLPLLLTFNLGALGLLGVASARNPRWGLAVLAAASAQPYLVTAGTALRPHDRGRFAVTRPVAALIRWVRVAAERDAETPGFAEARAVYAGEIAQGVERFLGPVRADCPWCGGGDLGKFLISGDSMQNKPGVFRLDECRSCGHIFQNPRLTLEGLDFYYRDYYDGLGSAEAEMGFSAGGIGYAGRANMVKAHADPASWLDVGGGLGHFCEYAKDILPGTRFDALDMGAGVVEAGRRGWVDQAYRGIFTEMASELAGSYDVVSMHHYLEHTLDPLAELDAAAKVLNTGGFLLIEVPDPQSPFGRFAGRWWHNWLPPQHINLVPLANLKQALRDRGMETVAVERGAAHQRLDILPAILIMLNRLFPDPARPWHTGEHRRRMQTARTAAFLAAAPWALAAFAVDQLASEVILRRDRGANTYRLLAQKTA